ncbi:hypothetical protein PO553_26225, partial [Klebsiella pneumoniae]
SAQIREILISESAWEEMTCLFAPSLGVSASECGLDNKPGFSNYENVIAQCSWANSLIEQRIIECYPELPLMRIVPSTGIEQTELGNSICRHLNLP